MVGERLDSKGEADDGFDAGARRQLYFLLKKEENTVINSIDSVVNAISGILYRPYIVPLFLIGAGIIFTILTKFI